MLGHALYMKAIYGGKVKHDKIDAHKIAVLLCDGMLPQAYVYPQDVVSYCRLVTCAQESAGKRSGSAGTKIGHAYLKWAFSAAAVFFLRNNPAGPK